MSSPLLSLLVCTIPEREALFKRLQGILTAQAHGKDVEIRHLSDNKVMTIGTKRQQLLTEARGQYVAFIDDDDSISEKYVELVLSALQAFPGATHCSLKGQIVMPGHPPQEFEHSTRYTAWETVNGKHLRTPNHLNTVRRDLALNAGYPAVSWGEDKAFSDRLAQAQCLNLEAYIEPVLYFYHVRPPVAQRPAHRGGGRPVVSRPRTTTVRSFRRPQPPRRP